MEGTGDSAEPLRVILRIIAAQGPSFSWPAQNVESAHNYVVSLTGDDLYGCAGCVPTMSIENYSQGIKSDPLLVFVNKVLLEYSHVPSFIYCLWLLSYDSGGAE